MLVERWQIEPRSIVLVESADHQSHTPPAKRSCLLQQKKEPFLVRSLLVTLFSPTKAGRKHQERSNIETCVHGDRLSLRSTLLHEHYRIRIVVKEVHVASVNGSNRSHCVRPTLIKRSSDRHLSQFHLGVGSLGSLPFLAAFCPALAHFKAVSAAAKSLSLARADWRLAMA
jgi:hypothetical protein